MADVTGAIKDVVEKLGRGALTSSDTHWKVVLEAAGKGYGPAIAIRDATLSDPNFK